MYSSRKFFSVEGVWILFATLQIKYNFQFFFIHFLLITAVEHKQPEQVNR